MSASLFKKIPLYILEHSEISDALNAGVDDGDDDGDDDLTVCIHHHHHHHHHHHLHLSRTVKTGAMMMRSLNLTWRTSSTSCLGGYITICYHL